MYSDCLRRRSVSIPAAVGEGFLTRNFSFRFGTLKGVFGVCAIVLFGYVAWHYTSAAQTNAAREKELRHTMALRVVHQVLVVKYVVTARRRGVWVLLLAQIRLTAATGTLNVWEEHVCCRTEAVRRPLDGSYPRPQSAFRQLYLSGMCHRIQLSLKR